MLDSNKLSFSATGALSANRRVKLLADGTIDYADAGDRAVGTLLTDIDAAVIAKRTGAVMQFATGIHWGTYSSATALAKGDELQAADDGKINKRTTGKCVGVAVETAAAAGDVIRYLPVIADEGVVAGDGDAIAQETSASTAVVISKRVGQITTVALTTAAGVEEEFVVTNTLAKATDLLLLSTTYAGTGTPVLSHKAMADGSFKIVISNAHASAAFNAAMVINFRLLQGAAAADLV